jgi:hypothetical protein
VMAKTPIKMQNYLNKLDALGLSQVRLLVPKEAEPQLQEIAEGIRLKYMQTLVKTAKGDDPRLLALSQGNLASAIKSDVIAMWRRDLTASQHLLFDKKVLTMQEVWSTMVLAMQSHHAAIMRDDQAAALRHRAEAAVAASMYKSAKDDLTRYTTTAVRAA